MDRSIASPKRPITFNSSLEAGVRAVAILAAAHPRSYDLQRMIAYDYLLVHSGEVGGPESLHPPAPLHSAEPLVRRKLIENALLLMMTRDLVAREIDASGIKYKAGEGAVTFLSALQSDYINALKIRALWIVDMFGDQPDTEFKGFMRQFFDRWVEEFQAVERSMGMEP